MALVEVVVAAIKLGNTNNLLLTLSLAAIALPGVEDVSAADASYFDINSQFSRYSESNNRMQVDVYQASAFIPISSNWDLKVNGVTDIVTGASPVLYLPGNAGKPFMVMSGASIHDVRDAVDITANYKHQQGSFAVGLGRSTENDYTSNFFSLDNRLDLNNKNTTLETAYSFSSDSVWAIDHCPPHCLGDTNTSGQYKRPGVGGDKSTHQGLIGMTQILDKNSLLQTNLTYTFNEGYLSDPYKVVYTPWVTTPYPGYSDFGGYSHDTRPGNRHQVAILTRYVRHFNQLNSAAVHLDYRFYTDNWGIQAHTFEAAWIQPLLSQWQLIPRVRYYSQNSADFYQPYFDTPRSDGHYSSDYRLAQFGAFSGGVELSKEFFETVKLGFGIDFYQRRQDQAISGGIGSSVDNYSFSILSAKLNVKF